MLPALLLTNRTDETYSSGTTHREEQISLPKVIRLQEKLGKGEMEGSTGRKDGKGHICIRVQPQAHYCMDIGTACTSSIRTLREREM